MIETLSRTEVLSRRMTALGLNPAAPLASAAPAEITGHLLAVQGQDLPAARWALGLRAGIAREGASPGAGRPAPETLARDVREAFDSGGIVRSWPMRGTVHLVAPADLGWIQGITNPRVLAGWPKRRETLGLSLEGYEAARELAVEALGARGRLSRAELLAHWGESGFAVEKGWAYHLVWALNQNGVVVFGPTSADGRDLDLVLAREWLREPRALEGEPALAELGSGFLRGHGPATAADLAWWAGIPLGMARRALAGAPGVVEIECAGARYWEVPGPATALPAGTVHLLGAFDEHLLGYRDRGLQLDAEHRSAVMTSNGIGQDTVVLDGRVIGVWNTRTLAVRYLTAEPAAAVARRVDEELQRHEAFEAASRVPRQ